TATCRRRPACSCSIASVAHTRSRAATTRWSRRSDRDSRPSTCCSEGRDELLVLGAYVLRELRAVPRGDHPPATDRAQDLRPKRATGQGPRGTRVWRPALPAP